MLHDVMDHYGLHRDFRHAGFFETEQYQQLFAELKTAIRQGQLVAVSGIVGCGKTTLLQRVQEELAREKDILVARSLAVDKDRVNLTTLIMALFYDLATEKDVKIPTQAEKRERQLLDLIKRRRRPIALFVDEAHDLHGKPLTGLKRLMELIRNQGDILAVVLAGHPKLKNDLRRPSMEEIGARATVLTLDGIQGQQREYITWLLEQCVTSEAEAILTPEAIDLLAHALATPLQVEQYLTLALEAAYRAGQPQSHRRSFLACWPKVWMTSSQPWPVTAMAPKRWRRSYRFDRLRFVLFCKAVCHPDGRKNSSMNSEPLAFRFRQPQIAFYG